MFQKLRDKIYNLKKDIIAVFRRQRFLREDVFNSQDYDEYWRKRSGHHLGALSEWQKERAEIILPLLYHGQISLADIGCGDGAMLAFLRNARKQNDKVIGLDSSAMALEFAKKLNVETRVFDLNVDFDLQNAPKADYYIFFEVLEHMAQAERILLSAVKKSKRGVFFSVPNTGYFKYRLRLLFGKFPVQWVRMPNEHLRFWTLSDMKFWLKHLGLKNAHIHTYQGISFLNKLWPSLFSAGIVVEVRK